VVYNSNPAAVAPDRNAVLRGLARDDLFTVVLEHFHTDTADWADIVLPATTQLEHWDIHFSYGHHYITLNQPSIAPVGEAKPNSEIFRLLASRMKLEPSLFAEDDLSLIRQALDTNAEKLRGIKLEALLERGWARLNVPTPYLPFAEGGFPTPSGKCEFYSERMAQMGLEPVPAFTAPYEFPENVPELAARYPLTLISSPAHQFLNTTFVNVGALRRAAREPECVLHPHDAEQRGIPSGARVVVQNDRGVHGRRENRGLDQGGCRLGTIHLVGEVRGRRRECKPDHLAARDRPRPRSRFLRQSRRGQSRGLMPNDASSVEHGALTVTRISALQAPRTAQFRACVRSSRSASLTEYQFFIRLRRKPCRRFRKLSAP
jgi:anaerobic selenocysteine-containing dehydrogenase